MIGLFGACGGEDAAEPTGATTTSSSASGSPGSSPARAAEALSVTDAWVKATEGASSDMTGAFMTILNDSDADRRLVSATSPAAGMVEIHEVVVVDGKNVMQAKRAGVPVPAGGFATLMPGADHVMLMELPTALKVGDEVDLRLTFDDGRTLDVTAAVKQFTEEMEHYHTGTATHSPTAAG
jgi:copper(I)-binding protein